MLIEGMPNISKVETLKAYSKPLNNQKFDKNFINKCLSKKYFDISLLLNFKISKFKNLNKFHIRRKN